MTCQKAKTLLSYFIFVMIGINFNAQSSETQTNELQMVDSSQYKRTCPSVEQCEPLIRKLKKYARRGSPKAQLLLAVYHLHGDGVQQNSERAMRWAQRAAKQKYPMAKRVISSWYRYGTAGVTDLEKANGFLKDAAEAGDPNAMLSWGANQLRAGHQNVAETFFQKAAEKGNKTATKILNLMDLAKDENGKVDLNADIKLPSNNNIDTASDEERGTVLTVTSQYEPIDMLKYFITNIDPVYANQNSTGSRLPGVRCGVSSATSPCRSYSPNGRRITGIKSKNDE